MRKLRQTLTASLLVLGINLSGQADHHSDQTQAIAAAIAAPERPEEDRARDINRKPDQVLAFFDIQPGQTVLDLFAGSGYYSEILSRLVGPEGSVVVHNDDFYYQFVKADLPKRFDDDRLPNTETIVQEPAQLALGDARFDRAIIILAYHDLYAGPEGGRAVPMDVPAFLAGVKRALKPGGYLGIVEHVAAAGTGHAAGSTLHRLDPALIVEELLAAGFELDGEAGFLANPADDGTQPMWAEGLRGQTDRVVLRFKKPEA